MSQSNHQMFDTEQEYVLAGDCVCQFLLSREDEYLFHTSPDKDFTDLERLAKKAFDKQFNDGIMSKLVLIVTRMSTAIMRQFAHVQDMQDMLPETCPKCNCSQAWVMTIRKMEPTFECYECGWWVDPVIWGQFIEEKEGSK